VWRIGIMGLNADLKVVNRVLESFKEALDHVGRK
jgi:aspartate aminotransferase-like enzyme